MGSPPFPYSSDSVIIALFAGAYQEIDANRKTLRVHSEGSRNRSHHHGKVAHRAGDKDARQEVGHVDGFDAADGETDADNKHTADGAHVGDDVTHKDVLHHAGKDGDAPLKAQHQNGGEGHANPQRRGEYHSGDKVQNGLNKEDFIVAAEPCFNRTDDGHRPYAKEQACSHQCH